MPIVQTGTATMKTKKELSSALREELLAALNARFEKNMNRLQGVEWARVKAKLEANPEKLRSLHEMERTGGEPDVVGHDKMTGKSCCSIVRRRIPKAEQGFVMTVRVWIRGRNTSRLAVRWIWQQR